MRLRKFLRAGCATVFLARGAPACYQRFNVVGWRERGRMRRTVDGRDDMAGSTILPASGRCRSIFIATAALLAASAAVPAQAGNSWALPLIGGAVGGYAISSFVNSRKSEPPPPVHHAAPPPAAYVPPPPAAAPATAQARLQQLDQLAAGGFITKAEYEQRRQAILSTL